MVDNNLLRCTTVTKRTSLAKSTIYYLIQNADFPKPVKLGLRTVAWREDEINAWIDSRERSL